MQRNVSIITNDTDMSRLAAEKTFVCFGCARGGTSMVGGLMQALGVNIGRDLPNNYEDPDFVAKGQVALLKAIGDRNERLPVWGWKFPNAVNYLDGIFDDLRNPRFIIVYRDLVATSSAHVRWHRRTFAHAMSDNLTQQLRNTFFAERHRRPTLFVSYEKAVMHQERFLDDLCEFLCVSVPDDKKSLVRFMEPESYKSWPYDKEVETEVTPE